MKRAGFLAAVALLLASATALVFQPVLGLELTGDDYQMAQFAHRTILDPSLALAPLGQFFRPLTNWSFVADRILWGTNPAGYHGMTLLFHLLAALALLGAGLRLGLGPPAASVVALLWAVSPFTDENAVWAAIRHQNFLMILWMGLVILWPVARRRERWSRWRVVMAGLVVVALVVTKESWVVTPLLVLVLAVVQQEVGLRKALFPAILTGILAVIYVALRFAFIPTTGGYFEYSLTPVLKVPHMLAAFLWLEELRPLAFEATVTGFLATGVVLGLAVMGARRRLPAACVGAVFVFVPILPVLLVPYLPQRYTAIPWAGFLLLVMGSVAPAVERLGGWRRWVGGLAIAVVAVLLLAGGTAVVRSDLEDWRRVSAAHRVLLVEARTAAPAFPLDRPVFLVRAERVSPLRSIALDPRGLYKLWFHRGSDPYGLIDGSALFDWVLDLRDGVVTEIPPSAVPPDGAPPRILLHEAGGFRWAPEGTPGGPDPVAAWRRRGLPVKLMEVTGLRRGRPAG